MRYTYLHTYMHCYTCAAQTDWNLHWCEGTGDYEKTKDIEDLAVITLNDGGREVTTPCTSSTSPHQ